jgi:hypothetical protein
MASKKFPRLLARFFKRSQRTGGASPSVKTSRDHNAGDSIAASIIADPDAVALLPLRRPRPPMRNVLLCLKPPEQKDALAQSGVLGLSKRRYARRLIAIT